MDGLLKYQTIMTAHIFLRIISVTTRLSKYLQTSGLDLLTAKRLISVASENINKISRDFDGVKIGADSFVDLAKGKVRSLDLEPSERSM